MSMRFLLFVFAALFVGNALADVASDQDMPSYYRNREDGWFWYKDPPPPPPKQKEAAPVLAPASARPPVDALQAKFEDYKKALEKARIAAFFEPTPQNLTRYAALQTDLVKRANEASDVWQRVIWANPEFDFTQERPVTRAGLNAYEENTNKRKQAIFEKLAATGVLYFFFRSDCPYCHEFAPTLARFSKATGIRVFAISLDGGNLPDFPRPQFDNGIAKTLGVTSWPALFLGEPAKSQITPIGYGVMSDMELADRLVEIANPSSAAVGAATPVKPFNPAALQ